MSHLNAADNLFELTEYKALFRIAEKIMCKRY